MSAQISSCCAENADKKSVATTKFRCPACVKEGQRVEILTLKHHVKPEFLDTVERGAFNFCRTPTCDVVYFNADGIVLRKPDVRTRIGLKETEDPVSICYCFGWTEKMAEDEIRATGKCTIPQRITAEVKAGNCACEIRNPQGSCCLGNVNAAVKRAQQLVYEEIPSH
jgi:hypothetical protein